MKKLSLFSIIAMAVVSVSCYPTRIVTVSPDTTYGHSTTVSYPNHSTTQVYASDYDLCLHLDLQAVGAAFAQAYTVREFEMLLNSPNYMISNLDLNRDGYIDYLRVVEAVDRYTHLFVIQAVLGRNIYQDVATLIVDNPSYAGTYVEIIGAPFLYGPKYIVRPIYSARPNIYAHLCVRGYSPWVSPWHWDSFPSYYKRPVPVHLSHYQAYVTTYMHNHRFCHEVMYPGSYHYTNYVQMTQHIQRNDYGTQHPEQSFVNRTANAAGANSAVRRAANARDVQQAQAASVARSANTTSGTNSRTQTATSGSRTAASTNSANTTSRSAAASNSNASTSRSSATTTSGSSVSRSSATNNSSATTGSSATSTSRSSASAGSSRSSASEQTTVSRVSSSGSARTTTSGGSTATSRSSDRSSSAAPATSSTSSSNATRSSASASRSSASGSSSSSSSSSRSSASNSTTSTSRSAGTTSNSSTSTGSRGRR